MIKRKEKIDYLVSWYETELREEPNNTFIFRVLNKIIIDSVGISGLEEVKKRGPKRMGKILDWIEEKP